MAEGDPKDFDFFGNWGYKYFRPIVIVHDGVEADSWDVWADDPEVYQPWDFCSFDVPEGQEAARISREIWSTGDDLYDSYGPRLFFEHVRVWTQFPLGQELPEEGETDFDPFVLTATDMHYYDLNVSQDYWWYDDPIVADAVGWSYYFTGEPPIEIETMVDTKNVVNDIYGE